MSEMTKAEPLPYEDRDKTLLSLVAAYGSQGGHSQAATDLFQGFLPVLTRSLRFEFPEATEEDILYYAWETINKVDLSMPASPCAYLLHCIRDYLRRRMEADRHGISENTIKTGELKKLKIKLELKKEERLIRAAGDKDADGLNSDKEAAALVPTTTTKSPLWAEVLSVLYKARWRKSLAIDALEVLESRIDSGGFDNAEASKELREFLPTPLVEALITFVTAPYGYMWARLHGVSKATAMALPNVKTHADALVLTHPHPLFEES